MFNSEKPLINLDNYHYKINPDGSILLTPKESNSDSIIDAAVKNGLVDKERQLTLDSAYKAYVAAIDNAWKA